jgi:hypothetical protein
VGAPEWERQVVVSEREAKGDAVAALLQGGFHLLHVRGTMMIVDPTTLSAHLADAGFSDVDIAVLPRNAFRFRARKTVSR